MAKTGINPTEDAINIYNDFKKMSIKPVYDYLIMDISADKKKVDVVHAPLYGTVQQEIDALDEGHKLRKSSHAVYDHMIGKLKEAKKGYGFFVFKYEMEGGGQREKVGPLFFCNDNNQAMTKMLHSGLHSDNLKKKLNLPPCVQCNDDDELEYENALACIKRNKN